MLCPNCGNESNKLIACVNRTDKLVCPNCHICSGNASSTYNLHQSAATYTDDKTGKRKKVTNGKAWEIKHRTVSKDDGKTIINSVTGKPAQY